jgi:peptidyl-dipeptidase A
MRTLILVLIVLLWGLGWASISQAADGTIVGRAADFIKGHETRVRPLEIEVNLAWWRANTSGKDEDFKLKEQSQNKLDAVLSDRARFAELKAIHDAKTGDALLDRQIHVLYLMYIEKQVDPELLQKITAKANAIEKVFNVYRAKVGGRELSDSQVRRVLKESKTTKERQEVWESSKGVGAAVEKDLKELVRLRNGAAKKLGFANYHTMQLTLNEQDPAQVIALFDELDQLTKGPFAEAKAKIDAKLAIGSGVLVDELMPWHYHDPFFQESPAVFDVDLDKVFANVDILKLCRDFYAGVGLPIDDVIAKSDLYERAGKSPHAFCTDIDRQGDVRVLANIVPNERWMGTMLHELGHSVYSSKNIPQSVPYVLRSDAHILCTEGIAMLFERFSKSADWLAKMGVAVKDPEGFNKAGRLMRQNQLLIFSRWCQVMLRFEKELYANPDQDLNQLWWDLVTKYQLLKRPAGRSAPDYASKIHIVSAPCYYHNYMMGELFACQVHVAVAKAVAPNEDPSKVLYVGDKKVGEFLKEKVFVPGRTLPWNELTRHATGSPLNPKAFADEFGGK